MARWRFAFLILTLSVAAGCPHSTPAPTPTPTPTPAAPAPRAQPSPPARAEAPESEWESEQIPADDQCHPNASVMNRPLEDPQDPSFEGPNTPIRFEDLEDRGAQGTLAYKFGKLEARVLDGRTTWFERSEEGVLVKAHHDDGRVETYDYLLLPGAKEGGCFLRVKEQGPDSATTRSRDYVLQGERPWLFGSDKARWKWAWKDGEISAEKGPRGQRRYAYDALKRLRSWSDDSGKGVTLEREGAETRYRLADGKTFALVEDAEGALREARQGQSRYSFEYQDGALRSAKGPLGTINYGSDEERGRRSVETPWGKSLTEYDELTERARWTETPAGTFEFSYAEGKRSELRYPNGVVTRYRYREGRDLLRLESGVLDLEREFNERGLLGSERRDGAKEPSRYGYDGLGRLNRIEEAGEDLRYAYTQDGHRIMSQLSAEERIADLRDGTRLSKRVLLRQGSQGEGWKVAEVLRTYRTDKAGRLLEIAPREGESDRFSYDGAGRLEVAQRAGQAQVRYAYDPLGRLASRTVGEGAEARVTRYVYDGPRLVAELGPGQALRVYAHGPDLDEPLAYRDGEGPWVFLHGDERGTVLAYSDAEGQRIDSVRFSPFGVLEEAPQEARPMFFAGHRYDPETRLVLARARTYDPELNRFLGPDPAGARDGANPFVYAHGNPLSFIDPLGLWFTPSTTRSHYGTLSPRAQLLLLQGVNAFRMAPSPKAPVLNLFKGKFADVQVPGARGEGETRTGRGPGAELSELLAQTETYEEAQELMASPLAEAARQELSAHKFKFLQGVAALEDDEARANDSELLRELLAPTKEEREAGVRFARRADLSMQFLDKYLDVKAPEFLRYTMSRLVEEAGAIKRRELLGTRAAELGKLDNVELAAALAELEQIARPANLSESRAKGRPAERAALSISTFAKRTAKSERYDSAGDERRAYRKARKKQSELWREHARVLASPAAVKRALRIDSDLSSPEDLFQEIETAERSAAKEVARTELAFREALVKPLGYAEAYRRISKDSNLFYGENVGRVVRESMPIGAKEALEGDVRNFTRLNAQIKEAKRPSYAARRAAITRALAEEKRVIAEREQERAQLAAAKARRAAKRRARRGAARGITLPGERVAPRASGVSVAVTQAETPKAGTRKAGKRAPKPCRKHRRVRCTPCRKSAQKKRARKRAQQKRARKKRTRRSGIAGRLRRPY